MTDRQRAAELVKQYGSPYLIPNQVLASLPSGVIKYLFIDDDD